MSVSYQPTPPDPQQGPQQPVRPQPPYEGYVPGALFRSTWWRNHITMPITDRVNALMFGPGASTPPGPRPGPTTPAFPSAHPAPAARTVTGVATGTPTAAANANPTTTVPVECTYCKLPQGRMIHEVDWAGRLHPAVSPVWTHTVQALHILRDVSQDHAALRLDGLPEGQQGEARPVEQWQAEITLPASLAPAISCNLSCLGVEVRYAGRSPRLDRYVVLHMSADRLTIGRAALWLADEQVARSIWRDQ